MSVLRRLLPAGTRRGTLARAVFKGFRAARAFGSRDIHPGPLSIHRSIPAQPTATEAERESLRAGDTVGTVRVTVVVPVHGHWALTEQCLRALELTEARDRSRVVVVDDASGDDTLEQLTRFPWVSVRVLPANLGFPRACNAGAADANTDYLLILNNDTEPLPGFLDALVELADSDSAIAIVGSRLVYPDGRLQEAGGIVWADGTAANYGRGGSPDDPEYLHVRDVDYCSAASILVRTKFFHEVGGFDSRYERGYYEDADLAFTARSRSMRVVYQPKSVVIHVEGGTHGTDPSAGIKRFQERNRQVFQEKWDRQLNDQPRPEEVPLRVAATRGPRRTVLYVDYQILTPNRDSGSLRSWELLRLIRDLGHETVFAAENGNPFSVDAEALRQAGTMVLGNEREIRSFLRRAREGLDCVFLARVDVAHRWQPWLSARYPDLPIVFDTVDLHHLRESMGARVVESATALKASQRTEAIELDLVRRCAATLVVSDNERRYLEERVTSAAVFTVGNVHHRVLDVRGPESRGGLIFVGSFLHTPNVDGIRWFLDDVWNLLPPDIQAAGLDVVGQAPPVDLIETSPPGVRFLGWVPDITPLLARARVSIAPLRFGAGVKGKVGEAWSHGLPVVGTTIAMDSMVEPGSPAHLVGDSPTEFARTVELVYRDEPMWRTASAAGREIVADRLSADLATKTLGHVLERVGMARDAHVSGRRKARSA